MRSKLNFKGGVEDQQVKKEAVINTRDNRTFSCTGMGKTVQCSGKQIFAHSRNVDMVKVEACEVQSDKRGGSFIAYC